MLVKERVFKILSKLSGKAEINDNDMIAKKIIEIKEKRDCVVYAVTKEKIKDYEMYSFLTVSPYDEDWQYSIRTLDNVHYSVSAYVWNTVDEHLSEFGMILIKSFGGGIERLI